MLFYLDILLLYCCVSFSFPKVLIFVDVDLLWQVLSVISLVPHYNYFIGCFIQIFESMGPDYKKILRLSYDVIITYDNRKSNLR